MPYLDEKFDFEMLVWDHKSSNLEADMNLTQALALEIKRLDTHLRAHNMYNISLGYEDFTELSSEYLNSCV